MGKETKLAKEIIKHEIKEAGYKVLKIILFGSRAKGKAREDSDWDFLVVVNKEISPQIKREIASNVRTKLVFSGIPADIILTSEKIFEKQLNDVGYITYYAVKEGLEI